MPRLLATSESSFGKKKAGEFMLTLKCASGILGCCPKYYIIVLLYFLEDIVLMFLEDTILVWDSNKFNFYMLKTITSLRLTLLPLHFEFLIV